LLSVGSELFRDKLHVPILLSDRNKLKMLVDVAES
jgi:hypothetical protein